MKKKIKINDPIRSHPKSRLLLQKIKTNHKKLQKENVALRQSQEIYRNLFLDAADCIYTLNLKGEFLSVNDAVIEAMKTTRKEVIGSNMAQWMTPESLQKAKDFMNEVVNGNDYANKSVEIEVIRKDGQHIWYQHKARPLKNRSNKVIGLHGIGRDITVLKRIQETLYQREEQYRKQFEEATDAIFLADPETGIVLDCNKAATLLVEREREEIIGMHQSQLHPYPDMVDGVSNNFKIHTTQDPSIPIEEKIITKLGKIKDVSIKASKIILNGKEVLQGIFRDITESKLLQRELERSLKYLTLAQNIAHVGSWAWDSENDIITWSDELFRIVGLDPEIGTLKYEQLAKFYTPESWQILRQAVEKALADGTPYELELEIVRPSGEHRWTLAIGQVLSVSPYRPKGLFGVVFDITERKRAQEILKRDKETLEKLVGERTSELLEAQKKLEGAKRLVDIGMLASTIAHELRNPLGVIKAAVFNINKKNRDLSLESHLANINKKIAESDHIIINLLGYSRIKMPDYTSIDVADVLNTCISQCKDKYDKWDIEVRAMFKNSKEAHIIEGDLSHIAGLFINILDNAYQAFPDKSGVIEITIDYNTGVNKLDIAFSDNGIGIRDADLSKIFEPFFTTKTKGIGLGLTVCKQIVDLHKGTIDIKSEKDKGTKVFVSLPIKKHV